MARIVLFTKEHYMNLPTIRIMEISLENFKSVRHGKVTFNCGKKFVPYGTQADILGVYGQNGSGKTSLIEALSILKDLLSGDEVSDEYADCIDVAAEYAALSFTFDVQYPDKDEYPTNKDVRKIVYSFKIRRMPKDAKDEEKISIFNDEDLDEFIPSFSNRVEVFDEVIKVGGTICGKKVPLKPFIDTTNPRSYIEPATKAKELVGVIDEDLRVEIAVNRRKASESSTSFIFVKEMLVLFHTHSDYSVYYQMLAELSLWGRRYLFVWNSKSTGLVNLKFVLPVYLDGIMQAVPINKRFIVSEGTFADMRKQFESLGTVLTQIVPGLSIEVADCGTTTLKDGSAGRFVEILARRGDKVIPLSSESDGVRKIIATLWLLIVVYNQQSTTVAYDEFDSGVFEYLLGEILQVVQTSGKGQFIFTSHNMRPLEVLKKEYIWFTTTDPDNRYIKISNVNETNNLRKVYYRELAMHEHYDNLYNETKRNLIVSALRKAGGN